MRYEQVHEFIDKYGKRGLRLTKTLGQIQGFMDALDTEVGKELLNYLMVRYDDLLQKIINLEANDEEKIELKVLEGIIKHYVDRINGYYERLKIIEERTSTADAGRNRR